MELPYDQYDSYYIAYLDILGFKEMIDKKPCSYIWDIYNQNMTRNPLVDVFNNGASCFDMSELHMKVMSDSVIFYVKESTENAFLALVLSCLSFQEELLLRPEPILIRGAIVRGKMFVGETKEDADVMFGPGFVEAYKMQEYVAKVPRIIMTKRTADLALRGCDKALINLCNKYLFVDNDEYIAIDVYSALQSDRQACKTLYSHIEILLSFCTDSSVREKYLYLKKNLLKKWSPQEVQNA